MEVKSLLFKSPFSDLVLKSVFLEIEFQSLYYGEYLIFSAYNQVKGTRSKKIISASRQFLHDEAAAILPYSFSFYSTWKSQQGQLWLFVDSYGRGSHFTEVVPSKTMMYQE